MASYMRSKDGLAIRESLQCDSCTDFDDEGFALPEGRCWVPVWAVESTYQIGILAGRTPDSCVVCGEALLGRM